MNKKVSLFKAIVLGQLLINLPITFLIIGCAILFICIGLNLSLGGLIGCAVGWLYWSFAIPKWRNWALGGGLDKDPLSKWGRITLLIWKEDSLFAKTEFRRKDEK